MDTKDTFVLQQTIAERGTGFYVAIKHVQNRVGWDWTYGLVNRLKDAWQGPLPCNPRLIKSNLDVPLNLNKFTRVHIRVTTTVHFQLIKEKVSG